MPSQLTQLKTQLAAQGLSRTSQPKQGGKGKNKRSFEGDKDRRKKALADIHERLNPFDVQVQRLKHDVGGRKVKGVTGKPAQSRQAGIEQRKATLLPALANRGKSSTFTDRRFGEADPTLDDDERMLERYTREKQAAGRRARGGAAFNLEDEDSEALTHYGQKLALDDDFAAEGLALSDDEEDKGTIEAGVVKRGHFGGFEDEQEDEDDPDAPPRKKTKAEVMAEVIAKSKEHKFLRQQQAEDDAAAREELDEQLDDIRDLLFTAAPPRTLPPSEPTADALRNPNYKGPSGESSSYDTFVRELAFERRAKPQDRLKSEAELALAAREELEAKEAARLRRMRGEEEAGGGKGKGWKARRERASGKPEGDDLEDDFVEEERAEDFGLGIGLGVEGQEEQEEGGEEDEGEDEDEEEEDEDGDGDEDGFEAFSDIGSDAGGESAPSDVGSPSGGAHASLAPSAAKSKKAKAPAASATLPFTFPCPATHDELLEILDGVREEDVPVVVQRIRVLYHPQLGEDNKEKLATFNTVLLDHVLHLSSQPTPALSTLSALTPHIYALSSLAPLRAAGAFQDKLTLMQRNLARGLARGALDAESRTWPALPELALLRLAGVVWSTSDLSHPIGAAAELLMGQYLAQARLRSLADLASGLVLCSLFLQYEALSKRFVPETLNFIANALLILAPSAPSSLPGVFPAPDASSARLAHLRIDPSAPAGAPRTPPLPEILDVEDDDAQARVDLFDKALRLLAKFAQLWTGLDAFVEAFVPACEILKDLKEEALPEALRKPLVSTRDQLSRQLKFSVGARRPLALQAHKPIPIATFVPKFEERYSADRHSYDPDRERAADAKLRAQYKRERKGAIRELRKDARFLAGVQQKKRVEELEKYEAKMRRKEGLITQERSEEKREEKEKARAKRRAGK